MENKIFSISQPIVSLRNSKNNHSELETEVIFGENYKVILTSGDWVFCKLLKDGYEGWLKKSSLGLCINTSHKVNVRNTLIFDKPDVKSNVFFSLTYGSEVCVNSISNNWAEIYFYKKNKIIKKYISQEHIVDINKKELNWVKIAEQFINTPYKWGGKSFLGIDCSGLVQLAILSKYNNASRNCSQQELELGETIYTRENSITFNSLDNLKRGDLIFWNRHVGIMINKKQLIHANAYHMCVKKEKLISTIQRLKKCGNEITKINRI